VGAGQVAFVDDGALSANLGKKAVDDWNRIVIISRRRINNNRTTTTDGNADNVNEEGKERDPYVVIVG
jgi:hypothetical protein